LTVQSTFISIFVHPFYNVYCFNLRTDLSEKKRQLAVKNETKEKLQFSPDGSIWLEKEEVIRD